MKHRTSVAALCLFLLCAASIPSIAQPGSGRGGRGSSTDSVVARHFGIRISNRGDTSFRYAMARRTRPHTSNGVNLGGNWKPLFSGYDRSMVSFTDSTIVPLKAGRTPLVVDFRRYSDTIALVIERVGENLVVDFDRNVLPGFSSTFLYGVNTWDTVGGAKREAMLEKITIGMSFDEANSLMKARTSRTTGEFPGTMIYPVDLTRSIYIQEKEGLVSKVWMGPRRGEW